MRKILFIAAILSSQFTYAQTPQKLGSASLPVYNPGMFMADSINLAFPDQDSTTVKAAFPTQRMKGRTGWQGNQPFVINGNNVTFFFAGLNQLRDSIAMVRSAFNDSLEDKATTEELAQAKEEIADYIDQFTIRLADSGSKFYTPRQVDSAAKRNLQQVTDRDSTTTHNINFSEGNTNSYLGLNWNTVGVADASVRFNPVTATMRYSSGRSITGWGGDHSFYCDGLEAFNINTQYLDYRPTNNLLWSGFRLIYSGNVEWYSLFNPSSATLKLNSGRYPGWTGKIQFGIDTLTRISLDQDTTKFNNLLKSEGGAYFTNTRTYHRIVCMGNSITANGTYPAYLANLLGSNWVVVNKGVGGNTTTQMIARFAQDVLGSGETEYIVIEGGINDVVANRTFSQITSNLQTMYTNAKNSGISVVATTITPFKANVDWTSARQSVIDSVNDWILNTATNVDYRVNSYAFLEKPTNTDSLLPAYSSDGLHMTTSGYDSLASIIYRSATWTKSSQTARPMITVAAGTTTSAPIRFNAGTNLTAPQAGAMEYNGTNFFLTPSSATRQSIIIGTIETGSDSKKYLKTVIDGTTYWIQALTALP